ncbi:barstar family protein [Paenibacillus filicis]|uniref:Barstar family protein n=1 Tax=Paenibacillus filicis TaxID=669464 RepID=A0ABU9DWA7_9BACL
MNKYLLIDEESNLPIGECLDIDGLVNEHEDHDRVLYEISIDGLSLNEEFIRHCMITKSKIMGIYIHILEQGEHVIGSYYFGLCKPYYLHKAIITTPANINLRVLVGCLSAPSQEAKEIWDEWMISKPLSMNAWAKLSQKQRLGWSEVVRIHSSFAKYAISRDGNYYLDMTHVTDSVSFYCALGEAMNGPGGYYGFNLDSLEDCFYGGFGAIPPFNLHFNIQKNKTDSLKLQRLTDLLISHQVTIVYP